MKYLKLMFFLPLLLSGCCDKAIPESKQKEAGELVIKLVESGIDAFDAKYVAFSIYAIPEKKK